ncbi:hypothetical protein CM19_00460 [Candidatus Acidianus copahuensis]|uniref:Uncharacterized protein n=1 Tax=Candidatus Acidianus copahuensis TaxID=1160895 RepID=A0A031LVB7_9CREN|nr:hypothetical protein CM19_00460 [Candidatus Acidianus copahuensis]
MMPSNTATYSSQWIGIGGFFSRDNSLIKTGTLSYSDYGKTYYSAWYGLLPASSTITNFNAKPSDITQAEIFVVKIINSTTQELNITLNDLTEHEHFSILVNYSSSLLSAEWIEERPEVNGHLSTLANFNISYYGNYYTGVPYTNYADLTSSSP